MFSLPMTLSDEVPESLSSMCIKYLIENQSSFCNKIINPCKKSMNPQWKLKNGITLPKQLCEKLIEAKQEIWSEKLDDKFVEIFKDKENTILKRAFLRNSFISDNGLAILLSHNLEHLDIYNCKLLTKKSIKNINKHGMNLKYLAIANDNKNHLFPSNILTHEPSFTLHTLSLKKLVLINIQNQNSHFFENLLTPLKNLTSLDLSNCQSIGNLTALQHCQNLDCLFLHNIYDIFVYAEALVSSICKIKSLRYLDISQDPKNNEFERPSEILTELVENLPNLTHLDISGTNLAGNGFFTDLQKNNEHHLSKSGQLSSIPGLQSRVKDHLKFIGLFETHYQACQRDNIPALMIAGNANELQLLCAGEIYLQRPLLLLLVLHRLTQMYRLGKIEDHKRAFNLIICGMMKHKSDCMIQTRGSMSLYNIIRNKKYEQSHLFRRKIISVVLDAMERGLDKFKIMIHGCKILEQLNLPEDLLRKEGNYKRLVCSLVRFMQDKSFIKEMVYKQRLVVRIVNELSYQVDVPYKILMGELQTIETMLKLISLRIEQDNHDHVLDLVWSIIWNVTDEAPINCKRFINGGGIKCFIKCIEKFPNDEYLLLNTMGLLGNVSEVKELRSHFEDNLILIFTNLIEFSDDGIEVSYNAIGILCHIMSDGPEAWTVKEPQRDFVRQKMVKAIKSWDIKSKRNISYRSLKPIVGLLNVQHTPECQFWAVWALANLTGTYPEKYCRLLEIENGLTIINDVISTSNNEDIIHISKMVLQNCEPSQANPIPMDEGE